MDLFRIDFDKINWEHPIPGVRHKVHTRGDRKLRLVEYTQEMAPHWCEKGHWGYILEGRFEIEFDDGIRIFEPGDGVFIPDGKASRHKAKVLGDVVRAVFVENVT